MSRIGSEIMRRRLPQIVGLYLVGSWGFVEFVDWAVEQYGRDREALRAALATR